MENAGIGINIRYVLVFRSAFPQGRLDGAERGCSCRAGDARMVNCPLKHICGGKSDFSLPRHIFHPEKPILPPPGRKFFRVPQRRAFRFTSAYMYMLRNFPTDRNNHRTDGYRPRERASSRLIHAYYISAFTIHNLCAVSYIISFYWQE